jgi:tetratricopeptide (TPR) repeat protein
MRPRLAFVLITFCNLLFSFAIAQTVGAQVTGKVIEANGQPGAGMQVTYTNTTTQRVYKVKTDKGGVFGFVGIVPGDYDVTVSSPTGEHLYAKKMTVTESNPNTVTIDLREGAAGAKFTPEQIEAMKKQREQAMAQNALITQALNAINAKHWQDAVSPLEQLIAADPSRYEFVQSLGDAYFNLGQYDKAVQSYQQGIDKAQSSTAVDPKNPATDPVKKKAQIASMLTNQGNSYLKLRKNNEAIAAYTKAADLDPNPGTAYFNLCATQYNTGNSEGALKACDKAIAAQPDRADAYFIKGSVLLGDSKTDKDGKLTAPPGTVEALKKYLELAPDGPHANDVKQMLDAVGAKVETTYSKGKGK